MGVESGGAGREVTEKSYYSSTGHHLDLINALVPTLGGELIRQLNRLVFCLVKPDAMVQGLAPGILSWLLERGYRLAYARMVEDAHPVRFEKLYSYNLTKNNDLNQLSDWWLNRQLFELGPALALGLTPIDSDVSDSYAHLAGLKGASSPAKCAPGTLRHEFGAINRSLNLLHVSDGPWSTAREFLIFDTISALADALATVSGPTNQSAQTGHALEVVARDACATVGCTQDLRFSAVMSRIAARVRNVRGCNCYDEILQAWHHEPKSLLKHLRQTRDRAAVPDIICHERPHALRKTLANNGLDDAWADAVLSQTAALWVLLTDWEELVIRTTAHYWHEESDPTALSGTRPVGIAE